MNKPSKTNIRTFVRFNNRTFKCGKYTFVPALINTGDRYISIMKKVRLQLHSKNFDNFVLAKNFCY